MRSKGQATRDRLIAAADDLIYRRGFAGASFEEIVAASGMNRGNIYYYFKSKDEILAAVVDRRLADVRATFSSWNREIAEPATRLRRFIDYILGRGSDLVESGCPVGTLSAELGKAPAARRPFARKLFDAYVRWLTDQMRSIGWPRAEARARALDLLARCQGAALLVHVYRDRSLLRRQLAAIRLSIEDTAANRSLRTRSKLR